MRSQFTLGLLSAEEVFALILIFPFAYSCYLVCRRGVEANKHTQLVTVVLLFGLGLIMLAQGMHLATNHLNDHLLAAEPRGSQLKDTAYFYDEHLGHALWFVGYIVSVSALMTIKFVSKQLNAWQRVALLGGAVINVLALTISVIEAQMVAILLGYAGLQLLWLVWWIVNRRSLSLNQWYYLLVFQLSVCLVIAWGLYHGRFIQFSELGWI